MKLIGLNKVLNHLNKKQFEMKIIILIDFNRFFKKNSKTLY